MKREEWLCDHLPPSLPAKTRSSSYPRSPPSTGNGSGAFRNPHQPLLGTSDLVAHIPPLPEGYRLPVPDLHVTCTTQPWAFHPSLKILL